MELWRSIDQFLFEEAPGYVVAILGGGAALLVIAMVVGFVWSRIDPVHNAKSSDEA